MNRNLFNLLSEAGGALTFSVMVATGLILEIVLPPGSGRMEMLGHGRRHQTIGMFFGLSRHEWGHVHLYASLFFLLFLVVHIVAHRKWIAAVIWGSAERPQSLRRRILSVIAVLIILLPILAPLIGERQEWTREDVRQERGVSVP